MPSGFPIKKYFITKVISLLGVVCIFVLDLNILHKLDRTYISLKSIEFAIKNNGFNIMLRMKGYVHTK